MEHMLQDRLQNHTRNLEISFKVHRNCIFCKIIDRWEKRSGTILETVLLNKDSRNLKEKS